MNITGADITGGGRSARNPANEKAKPSMVEDFVSKLMEKPNPRDEPLTHIGTKPPADDAYIRGVIDRRSIVNLAMTLTDRVSEHILVRVCDSMFNEGISIEALRELSALEINENSVGEMIEILDSAKLIDGGPPVALEKVEAVVTVARAFLKYLMTHHGEQYTTGTMRYEQKPKTPFKAWRLKEEIQEWLMKSEPIVVNKGGYDTRSQCDEFFASFNIADIVLWNRDIWKAAVRGYDQAFLNTKLSSDVVQSLVPMFWEFEAPIAFDDPIQATDEYLSMNKRNYECVGISVMPHRERLVEVVVEDSDNSLKVTPHPEDPDNPELCLIEMDSKNPNVRKALGDANRKIDDGEVIFAQYGISIGMVYMPLHDKSLPPEIRFFPAIFEGQEIITHITASVVAAAKFLTLKYVAKDDVQISKKEIKQDRTIFKAVRRGKIQVPPIKVINLRRPERRERTAEETAQQSKRNYTCWWMVDAHWRKQYYPSLGRHQQVRILAYPKGDFTKPFKPPREKIFKAVR